MGAEGGAPLPSARGRRRGRLGCAVALLIGLGVLIGLRTIIFRATLYAAPGVAVGPPPPGLEELVVEGGDGARAVGWAWAGDGDDDGGGGGPVLLVFHGNGENLQTMAWAGTLDDLRGLGAPFLVLDYPGYGRSGGRASHGAVVAAGVAGLAALSARHPGAPIVVVGWSLGGAAAVATAAASPERVAGLAVLEAWADLPAVAQRLHVPSWLAGWAVVEHWNSAEAARALRVPALLVHGTADDQIPIAEGRRLRDAFADRARWVEVTGAGHNDLLSHAVVWDELGTFLAGFGRSRR